MDKSIGTPDHYTGRTLMTSHSKYIGPDLQGKIVWERNSKKMQMGVESSACDLLTTHKLKNTDAAV